MKSSRYARSRQKACKQCSAAKARCDRKGECCTRCSQRGLLCVRPSMLDVGGDTVNGGSICSTISLPESSIMNLNKYSKTERNQTDSCSSQEKDSTQSNGPHVASASDKLHPPLDNRLSTLCATEDLDFSELNLFCPINAGEISSRWINPYISDPGKKVKNYPPNVLALISRILGSYAATATRGSIPSFVHPLQMKDEQANSPLTTCLCLIRICQDPLPGSESATVTVLQREMKGIAQLQENHHNDLTLLAALQAFLLYAMVLYFRMGEGLDTLRQSVIPLQTLAHLVSQRGLVCAADKTHIRPRWEEWIVAEAKRRTLYVIYLFDSVLCAQDNLPVFLGSELEGLPAPSSKYLWQAPDRRSWERVFNAFLAEWNEGGLTIDELWPVPMNMDDHSIVRRQIRINRWLEDVDEFGTMLYAITCCTHGS